MLLFLVCLDLVTGGAQDLKLQLRLIQIFRIIASDFVPQSGAVGFPIAVFMVKNQAPNVCGIVTANALTAKMANHFNTPVVVFVVILAFMGAIAHLNPRKTFDNRVFSTFLVARHHKQNTR